MLSARKVALEKERRSAGRKIGGRPPKFGEPSRPVTLTLPESTLADLDRINPDRSVAIVEMTEKILRSKETRNPLVEIVETAKKTGLVIVGPSKALQKIPFLRLVGVAPARHILVLERGHNFHDLELAIIDTLDDAPQEKRERELLTQLLRHVKGLRKSRRVSMAQILVVRVD